MKFREPKLVEVVFEVKVKVPLYNFHIDSTEQRVEETCIRAAEVSDTIHEALDDYTGVSVTKTEQGG